MANFKDGVIKDGSTIGYRRQPIGFIYIGPVRSSGEP